MRCKLFLLLIVFLFAAHYSYSQNKNRGVKIVNNGDALRGDTGPLIPYYGPPALIDNSPLMGPFISSTGDNILSTVYMTELNTNARTTYDLQSNGIIHYICQEPGNPNNIHAIFMTATIPNTWDDRNTRYFYSSNGGTSWTYFGTIGATRSGFPWLSITPNGNALVTMHNLDGGGILRGQLYVESFSGSGSFARLDPGLSNSGFGNVWMIGVGTNTKALVLGSQNGQDSLLYNITTSFTPPGAWVGWRAAYTPSSPPATAQSYSAAK